jgi:uncharacterized membrane protein YfcA
MYIKETIWMALVGIISVAHGVNHYIETERLDLMSVVFTLLSVLYFAAIVFKKDEQ